MLTWSCMHACTDKSTVSLISLCLSFCVQPLFGEVKIDIQSQRLFLLFTNSEVSRVVALLRLFIEIPMHREVFSIVGQDTVASKMLLDLH